MSGYKCTFCGPGDGQLFLNRVTEEWPTTHEVTWPSIVSAMAICRQALPAQLEYPP
jgi:hypothetical protein